jgi:hypothetical protein
MSEETETEGCARVISILASCFGCPEIKIRSAFVNTDRFFVVFFDYFMQMLPQSLKLGNDHFVPCPPSFEFTQP